MDPDMHIIRTSRAAALAVFAVVVSCPAGDTGLSLWETGGMYFCVPYNTGATEVDLNAWHEDGASGYSLYGSYAFSENVTIKLEIPSSFESSPLKITGLFGMQNPGGDMTLSGDINAGYSYGEGWSDYVPTLGCNAGIRLGVLALLSRLSAGAHIYRERNQVSIDSVCEAEVGPFIYTGDFGMVGLPIMFEYGGDETALNGSAVNCALDWELYLPGGFSLWVVPRYEVRGSSGFSIWTGIAWMRMPE